MILRHQVEAVKRGLYKSPTRSIPKAYETFSAQHIHKKNAPVMVLILSVTPKNL